MLYICNNSLFSLRKGDKKFLWVTGAGVQSRLSKPFRSVILQLSNRFANDVWDRKKKKNRILLLRKREIGNFYSWYESFFMKSNKECVSEWEREEKYKASTLSTASGGACVFYFTDINKPSDGVNFGRKW